MPVRFFVSPFAGGPALLLLQIFEVVLGTFLNILNMYKFLKI
jgi:hypothetical protein